jgi:hypothetical protein
VMAIGSLTRTSLGDCPPWEAHRADRAAGERFTALRQRWAQEVRDLRDLLEPCCCAVACPVEVGPAPQAVPPAPGDANPTITNPGQGRTRPCMPWTLPTHLQELCAAGMLNAERSFRRLKGYRQMPTFVAALARHVEAVTPACDAARVA